MTRFYRLFAVIYQIICFCGLSGICCGYPNLLAQSTARYAFEHPQMGTTFRIVVFAPGETQARLAAKKAFDRIDTLNSHMSDYIPESEVSRLTAHPGQWQPVSDDLWEVLVRAQKISRISKGVFDISVGPLTRLWRRAMRQQEMPPQAQIEKVRQAVNYRHVRLRKKDHSVMLLQPDMKLDLGAIAKGYATDAAWEILQNEGLPVSLIDGGGDLRLGNPPPESEGWKVEISSGEETSNSTPKILYLSDCGVATSGDTYRYIESEGKRYSHIIDPRTGYGISSRRLVTVVAPNGTDADALASVVSIVGQEEGKKVAKKLSGRKNTAIYFTEIH